MVKSESQNLELLSKVSGSATDALCYFRQHSPYSFLSLGRQGKDDMCLPLKGCWFWHISIECFVSCVPVMA